MLHFVVVGGSPFAVEFAAELQGYLSHIKPMFPGLSDFTKVTLVESQDHINNYYDKNISSAMRKRFITEDVNVIPSKSLAEVGSNFIAVKEVDDNGKETISKIPCGMTVWGTGIAAHPLVEKLRKKLPHQNNARALVTNPSLVVLGTENVYAIGDCATIDQGALLARWEDVFKTADADGSGTIDLKEFENLVHTLARRYPAIREVAHRAEELFAIHDVDKVRIPEHHRIITFSELIDWVGSVIVSRAADCQKMNSRMSCKLLSAS
jgi:NADH:ubiquinone reductase (non-electrogenic)